MLYNVQQCVDIFKIEKREILFRKKVSMYACLWGVLDFENADRIQILKR